MSTIHIGAPGANATEHVLVQPVARSVTVRVRWIWNPGAPQLPDEKVIVCSVLEPTIFHPAGLPSTVIAHDKLYNDVLSGVVIV